jgi:hypothetical protein
MNYRIADLLDCCMKSSCVDRAGRLADARSCTLPPGNRNTALAASHLPATGSDAAESTKDALLTNIALVLIDALDRVPHRRLRKPALQQKAHLLGAAGGVGGHFAEFAAPHVGRPGRLGIEQPVF